MLTFFPKPYPDEILYSLVARFHIWSGNDKITDTTKQLFDNGDERATLLIPKHLQRLAEKTIKFGLDYEKLLYDHTIFPFASCFLKKDSFDKISDVINNVDQKEKTIYIYKNNLISRHLRYCPLCISDDRDLYGEAYWHRRHQLYGIEMCQKHRCRLKESSIDVIDNRNNRYIALELLNGMTNTMEQVDISDFKIELQIANDVDYIFKNYEFVRNLMYEKQSSIREAIIEFLFKRDLATKKGLIKINKLKKEFLDRYGSIKLKQLLVELNIDLKWLIDFCRGGRTSVVPIRLILFADFLAGSIETYIKSINNQGQFIEREKEVFQLPDGYENKLLLYRRRWLDAWGKNANGCRCDLIKIDRPAYTWLRRHDTEWLLTNSPQIKRPKVFSVFNDWVKIDSELEIMVDDAVFQIKNLVGKPERITKTNIGRYMRQKDMIEGNFRLLPRTMYKINQYVESTYDYQLRRISWVKTELQKEGRNASYWITMKKAGISDKDGNKFRYLFTS